jgi:hypothetical protein
MARLIRRSSLSLIMRAAGAAARYHSPAFAAMLEAQSPFRFTYLEERSERMRRHGTAMTRLFEAFLDGEDDEPAFPHLPGWISAASGGARRAT